MQELWGKLGLAIYDTYYRNVMQKVALLKLNKVIYIVISWNNGSAVLTLQNDNQTLYYAVSLNVFIR